MKGKMGVWGILMRIWMSRAPCPCPILWRIPEPRWALGVMNCVHTWNFGFLEPPMAHGTRGQCHVAPEQGDGLSLWGQCGASQLLPWWH